MTRHYCTGLGPVTPGANSCCKQHDNDYGAKGTVSRAEADRRLRQCMIAQGKPLLAWLFWAACRAGGWYFWKDKTHDNDRSVPQSWQQVSHDAGPQDGGI